MTAAFDPKRIAAELKWSQDNPQFAERPATIREFVGPHYLDIASGIRPANMVELEKMVGKTVHGDRITEHMLAMYTGGIGIGKTTVASIILPYLAHWVLCLYDPQAFFNLLPGSRIAFMQMSTSEKQAKDVIFGDIKARIQHSPWFQQNFQFDSAYKNQLRFEKDIWILPGDSEETTFEGYNILGGILDEADSHKMTENKDYAEQGYNTIYTRMTSRFQDRGFLLVIGQMKKANGFASRKYDELSRDPKAYVTRMAIWDSFGWDNFLKQDGTRDSFWYDTKRHEIVPEGVVKLTGNTSCIEVPTIYRRDFDNNPEKALRDLAGIPPATGSAFISLVYRIEECRERWKERFPTTQYSPSPGDSVAPALVDLNGHLDLNGLHAPNSLKRVCHIDLAYSGEGDSLGFAMGHVPEVVEIEGERKPFIVFDLILRWHAPAGQAIFIGDIRRLIYDLRDECKFKIDRVTMDGFQSTDTLQQLRRRRIDTEIVSIDKQLGPYYDLREAIYERRVDFPQFMVRLRADDTVYTEIAIKELSELIDNGNKIDHPVGGSKDVADAMAGVVYSLMGDRSYHRQANRRPTTFKTTEMPDGSVLVEHPALVGMRGMKAPIPSGFGDLGTVGWNPPRRGRG